MYEKEKEVRRTSKQTNNYTNKMYKTKKKKKKKKKMFVEPASLNGICTFI